MLIRPHADAIMSHDVNKGRRYANEAIDKAIIDMQMRRHVN